MRIIYIIIFLSLASTISFADIYRNELKVGDVILLPMKCWVCSLIEEETSSIYSHSGVVLSVKNGNIKIGQSLGEVHSVTLNDFLRVKDTSRNILVVRSKELIHSPVSSKESLAIYNKYFKGLPFDHDYLWDNFKNKEEKLYCSEFITKFLNKFLKRKIKPLPMSYVVYYEYWRSYFHHSPPDGLLGISPSFYENSKSFIHLGQLRP